MNYTIFNKNTGQILRHGTCPDDQFLSQAQGDEIVEGIYSDDEYYWDNEFISKPAKPVGNYDFNYVTKSWVLNSVLTISQNRAKRNQILLSSDWTQGGDSPLSTTIKASWASYRQALRDMTEQDFMDGNFPIY